MRTLLNILIVLSLVVTTACTGSSETSTGTGGTWHFADFTEVRAYRLNWDDESSFDPILDENGALNPTRVPIEGLLLTSGQVQRLEAAVTGTHPDYPVAACFYPHHAFVFYNEAGNVVGEINICFLCSNYDGKPKGYAKNWDLEALQNLISELGMAIRNPKWD